MRYLRLPALLIVAALLIAACGGQAPATPAAQPTTAPAAATAVPAASTPLKVAFIYVAPIGDFGWNYEHEQGRLYVQEKLGGKVETAMVESVPEGPDVERVLRDFANKGFKLIFATSYGYMDFTLNVAKEFPDVRFVHISGFKRADNVSTVFARMQESRYLSGLVAGKMMPQGGVVGCVCSFPLPLVLSELNAFMVGVREVNPTATMKIVWTSTWFDPPREKEAADALIAEGIDLLVQYQDTMEPQKAASAKGVLSIGFHSDMGPRVGSDTVLTSNVWNWGPKYLAITEQVMAGTYVTEDYWEGLKDGVVDLAPFSDRVPQDVRDLVAQKRQAIVSGQFQIFAGPLKDQSGTVRVQSGSVATRDEIWGMDWLHESIVTPLPKS